MSRAAQAAARAAEFIDRRESEAWSAADQAELEIWLAGSYGNRAAYWRLEQGWRFADRAGALGAAVDNIARVTAKRRDTKWLAPKLSATALAATILVGLSFSWAGWLNTSEIVSRPATPVVAYATNIGAHRQIPLPDGSRIELNTLSRLRAMISPSRREIWLDTGEAYFSVAHQTSIPFVVHAGTKRVTVLGTKFSVRRDGHDVTVLVAEGRVRLSDEARSTPTALVAAGEKAVARGPSVLIASRALAHVDDELAWRSGMLRFNQASLANVAADFNRYNLKRIEVRTGSGAELRIGGAFPATRPDAFVRLLRDAYGVSVEERPDRYVISN